VTVTWVGSDPTDDPLVYNFYLGDTPNPPMINDEIRITYWEVPGLHNNTDYYWRVNSKDPEENMTVGPVWHFRVENNPPESLAYISPENGATNVGIDFQLTWHAVDPENYDMRYDIYFGPDSASLYSSNWSQEYYTSRWFRQAYMQQVLNEIYTAQESYRQQNGTYCLNGITASRSADSAFAEIGIIISSNNSYTYNMTASANTFSCTATANMDNDPAIDTWSITQDGIVICSVQDLEESFQYSTVYYWKIIARDTFGQQTEGPVWSFITVPQ